LCKIFNPKVAKFKVAKRQTNIKLSKSKEIGNYEKNMRTLTGVGKQLTDAK
jgi:hypothetical protein